MQLDKQAIERQIEVIFSQLQAQLTQSDAAGRRDAAYAAYEELEALSQSAVETKLPGAESAECRAIEAVLTDARRKAWSLYDAYHQDLQHQLEWASTRDYE